MKQAATKLCPRCKSILTKSHNEKVICRTCGFIKKDLQVARENQQFQQRIHYGKKIAHTRNVEFSHINESDNELREHFVMSFQRMLRSGVVNLYKQLYKEQQSEYKRVQYNIRNIWLEYLRITCQYRIEIGGIFRRFMKNEQKTNNSKSKEDEQGQGQEKKLQEDQENGLGVDKQMKENPFQQWNKNEEKSRNKRRRQPRKRDINQGLSTHEERKIPFKLQIRKKIHQLNTDDDLTEEQQRINLLQFVYDSHEKEIDKQTINYLANKYCALLVQTLRSHNLNIGVSYAKGRPVKVTTKELQLLIQSRGLKISEFSQKNQMIVVLFLEDLLRKWSHQLDPETDYSLETLLRLYKSTNNTVTKVIITQTINQLMILIGEQNDTSKKKNNKMKMPQLSLNLAYAIIYIGSLMSSQAYSIDDIVSKCGAMDLIFLNEVIIPDEQINNNKIRKTAATLIRVLNLKCEISQTSVRKWTHKYADICGLAKCKDQIDVLSDVLFESMNIANQQKFLQQSIKGIKRYDFLEQDMLGKAIIIVYIKLEIGFQKTPYLASFPPQLIAKLAQAQQKNISQENFEGYIKLLQKIIEIRDKNLSLVTIIRRMEEYFIYNNDRTTQLKFNFSPDNYSSLQNMDMATLTKLVKRNQKSTFNFSVNIASKPHSPPSAGMKIIAECVNEKSKLKLSSSFVQQITQALQDEENGDFDYKQLDIPCSNYQFFYEYMASIKLTERNLFAYFVEILAGGQCKVQQLYQWLQRLQKVMIDFEN